jgi:hypothetical protein
MKKLILLLCSAGLFTACECYDEDLYRCSYERPRVFCWDNYNYDETDNCRHTCRDRGYSVYAEKAYIRIYKGPVYNYRTPVCNR